MSDLTKTKVKLEDKPQIGAANVKAKGEENNTDRLLVVRQDLGCRDGSFKDCLCKVSDIYDEDGFLKPESAIRINNATGITKNSKKYFFQPDQKYTIKEAVYMMIDINDYLSTGSRVKRPQLQANFQTFLGIKLTEMMQEKIDTLNDEENEDLKKEFGDDVSSQIAVPSGAIETPNQKDKHTDPVLSATDGSANPELSKLREKIVQQEQNMKLERERMQFEIMRLSKANDDLSSILKDSDIQADAKYSEFVANAKSAMDKYTEKAEKNDEVLKAEIASLKSSKTSETQSMKQDYEKAQQEISRLKAVYSELETNAKNAMNKYKELSDNNALELRTEIESLKSSKTTGEPETPETQSMKEDYERALNEIKQLNENTQQQALRIEQLEAQYKQQMDARSSQASPISDVGVAMSELVTPAHSKHASPEPESQQEEQELFDAVEGVEDVVENVQNVTMNDDEIEMIKRDEQAHKMHLKLGRNTARLPYKASDMKFNWREHMKRITVRANFADLPKMDGRAQKINHRVVKLVDPFQ